ncbi:uncharacterized protein B0I36DRAFT_347483 [Microdochium trichocladiopsis]|uniref:CCHC-type domain-containing protein n=1 Tax=Microdochium trichocladiopsis TaxID=1682393 RepID=A0A9P8YD61_9PEZI|nr:uncharacterized protein B0I36DRAFT_347483 [Microdochium trichocladiopsis]KAH7035750.1 hypothetical protein B0I36DRAFT_347483 [Microdochium trichocladiopsis]
MVDGVPGYHGGAGDPPCYNCGIRGHWFNACPEPARKIPAGRDYGRDRPRYSPREASPHRQRQGQDQSPPHRSAAVERRGRHERRRDDPPGGSNGSNNRKGDRSQSKQTNSKVSEKQNERPRADKAQRQQRQSASDTKAPAPDGEILQWGLVVPYMPVWDFEEAEATDSKVESRGDRPFEEDDDFEWMLGQLFADWVPYYQSRPISKPLPQEYSEEDIPSPNGYDDVLQTEYITATNVDHFALSIRDTKEWRIKKWFPLWADPLDIHPRMLARLADHDKQSREQSAREGSQHASMKANGRPPADKANQGDKTKIAGVRSPHEALVAPSPDKHGKGDAKRSLSGNNSFVQRLEQDDRQHDVHLKRYNSSRQSPPDNRQAQLFKAHEDEQQRPANYEHASANNESRGSKGQLSDRQGLSEENSTTSIDTFKHKHSLDRDARGPRTQVGIEQDTIKVASPHESTVRHTCETNDPERPSSRGSLRSWHSRGRVSRQASIVSELSHPESPLTPTEMALLGIEGSDDDDSDSDSEKGGKAKVSLTPPPPPTPQRQKQAHRKGDDVSATKSSRALKRQAPTATVEETTPRTKKRRQQVASAFNRRW